MRTGTSSLRRYVIRLAPVFIAIAAVNACGEQTSSKLGDIYENDAQTRRHANPDEIIWTVDFNGCTGSMLSAKYALTASHCSPSSGRKAKSGSALLRAQSADMIVQQVVESSSNHDYAIVEIRWIEGTPPADQKYSPFISTKAEDLKFGKDAEATKLLTVGFPVDKDFDVTYAEGYAKKYSTNSLYYNIGTINGNSGGPVWRAEDHMLVSLTNFGSHAHGQPGWNHNDPENPNAWNGGTAFYKVFAQSETLRRLFPGGNNMYVDDSGNLELLE